MSKTYSAYFSSVMILNTPCYRKYAAPYPRRCHCPKWANASESITTPSATPRLTASRGRRFYRRLDRAPDCVEGNM